jgi:hypothetical protein
VALADPTITLAPGVTDFTLISTDGQNKTYRSDDGLNEIIVSHSEKKRNRRSFRLNRTVVTADPFIPANNVEVSYSFYMVVDHPVAGFSIADMATDLLGTVGWLTTAARETQWLAGES